MILTRFKPFLKLINKMDAIILFSVSSPKVSKNYADLAIHIGSK